MDTLNDFLTTRIATADRPLMGLTVLLVEDSRFASDAFRLLCLRSGARIRRADSIANAHRHLKVYRPAVVIVDIGLPDGSGAELISELDRARPRAPVILATSGDEGEAAAARVAGADGFLAKPVTHLATFQAAILEHLPSERHPRGLRLVSEESVSPDRIAYRDDLAQVAIILDKASDDPGVAYVSQFAASIARSAGDGAMADAAAALRDAGVTDAALARRLARLGQIVESRMTDRATV